MNPIVVFFCLNQYLLRINQFSTKNFFNYLLALKIIVSKQNLFKDINFPDVAVDFKYSLVEEINTYLIF